MIALNPKHSVAHLLPGIATYERDEDAVAAEAEILKAVELAPQSKWVRYYLGDIYRKEGRTNEAAAMYEQALAIDPDFEAAQKRLAALKAMSKLHLMKPPGYLEFLNLMANARLVLTDSGGIQEETTILGVPCLTLRENTERPVTVTRGTSTIVGCDPQRIVSEALAILDGKYKAGRVPVEATA